MKLIALAAAALFFQFATNPAPQQESRKGGIEGIVVGAGTGQPVAGARVTATRVGAIPAAIAPANAPPVTVARDAAPPPTPSTSATDAAGRFAFSNLDEGLYRLQVQANGYVQQVYGERYAGGPGVVVALNSSQQLKDISIGLTPAGNISGRIRDASDRPLINVPVRLLRYSYDARGQRTFQSLGQVKTDDRGEYRIYWVTPGHYYLMAGHPPTGANPLLAEFQDAESGGGNPNRIPTALGYAYYPGVTDIGAALPLDVRSGEELQGIDLTMTPMPRTYSVRGRVIDSQTGQPPRWAKIAAFSKAPGSLQSDSNSFTDPEDDGPGGGHYDPTAGTFVIRGLLPGTYIVTAAVRDAPTGAGGSVVAPSRGTAAVAISDSDAAGIVLRVAAPATISGRLQLEGDERSNPSVLEMLRLVSIGPGDDGNGRLLLSPNNQTNTTFEIHDVAPGEYRVGFIGYPNLMPAVNNFGRYIKEARFEGVDVLNAPLSYSGAASGTLDIVVATGAGQINGVVRDARSKPASLTRVVLVPDRGRDRIEERYKITNTDQNGRFTMQVIPPGDYKLFAWESIEDYEWFDPEVLARSEGSGRAVHVSESSNETVTLKLIPAGVIR